MKKLIRVLVVLLLCAATWAGATYFVGGRMQKMYSDMVETYGNMGPVSCVIESYQRDFRQAKARLVIELKIPANQAIDDPTSQVENFRMVLEESITHGPLVDSGLGLATIETRLVEVTPTENELAKLLNELPELAGVLNVTKVDLDGTMHGQTQIPAIHTVTEDGNLNWDGLQATTTFSPRKKSFIGTIDCAGLEGEFTDGLFAWDGLKGKFDLVEALPLLYLGQNDMQIGQLNITVDNQVDGEQEKVELKGFGIVSDSRMQDGLVSLEQTLSFAGILVDGQNYGPGELTVAMANLDGQTLSDFQQKIYALYGRVEVADPEALVAELMPLYTNMLLQLLEKSPQLDIRELQFTTPHGNISGDLQISYDGSQGASPAIPNSMFQAVAAQAQLAIHESLVRQILASQVTGELHTARQQGQIPETVTDQELENLAAQQIDTQLEAMLAQNYIIRDGDLLKTNATLNNGELLVNGLSIPLFQ
ncbi:MAG: YdgA family protein [Desulfuromonadaceae bacterium]